MDALSPRTVPSRSFAFRPMWQLRAMTAPRTSAKLATLVCDQITEFMTAAFSSICTPGPMTEFSTCAFGLIVQPSPMIERLSIDAVVATNDGFKIAEADLALRGPGEFFGTRQSGLPEFRVADLLRDGAVLEEARRDAETIVAGDPDLRTPAHRGLREMLLARWRGKIGLASVG